MIYLGPFTLGQPRYRICLRIGLGQDGLQHDISRAPSAGVSPDIGYAFELGWAEMACNMI